MSDLVERLVLRGGTLADYRALAEFHYLRQAPVTATRVLTLVDPTPGVLERWGDAPRGDGRVVGVLVESLPALGCALRDRALGGRYRGWSDRSAAARLLNAEVRCISRVVVHPQWRGLGLAVRLVREAMSTMSTPYLEALASMGRVHPFFALAGMREYERWPHPRDQRLIDALRGVGLEAWELACVERVARMIEDERCGTAEAALVRRELGRWAGRSLGLREQLIRGRDRLLCRPVYYLTQQQEPRR